MPVFILIPEMMLRWSSCLKGELRLQEHKDNKAPLIQNTEFEKTKCCEGVTIVANRFLILPKLYLPQYSFKQCFP